jgi:antitoxin (DNA-binding transcriptional repressor) of toxin-antitoxin stability system
MTKTVDISEAQIHLFELISLASEGNEIIIAEGDKPLARIVPITNQNQKRIPGLNRGKSWVSDDFDESVPEEFWTNSE